MPDPDLDLSGLADPANAGPSLQTWTPDHEPERDLPTEADLQANAKDALWEAGEMAPPEDIAYSLHRMDDAANELLILQDRQTVALETIAATLRQALPVLVKALAP